MGLHNLSPLLSIASFSHSSKLINVGNIYKIYQRCIDHDHNDKNIEFKYQLSLHPDKSIIGWTSQDDEKLIYQDFKESKLFMELLHKFVKSIAPSLNYIQAEARNRHSGWIPIVDHRIPMELGSRTPDNENVIGMIKVENNVIIPESYQSMPVYRLISSNGFFILPSMELFIKSFS